MQVIEQQHQAHVAHEVNGVGHDALVSLAQLLQSPTQQSPVEIGKTHGQDNGKEIHQSQHQQSVGPRKQAHVSEREQDNGSDGRVVHGSEQTTEYAGYDDMFSHLV